VIKFLSRAGGTTRRARKFQSYGKPLAWGLGQRKRCEGDSIPIIRNDSGELTGEDKRLNGMRLIKHGGRILSAYILPNGTKIWCITDAQSVDDDPRSRMSTCILLPEEY
jgi:hypothetical protein